MRAPEEAHEPSQDGSKVKGVVDLRAQTGSGIGRGLFREAQIVPPSECHTYS